MRHYWDLIVISDEQRLSGHEFWPRSNAVRGSSQSSNSRSNSLHLLPPPKQQNNLSMSPSQKQAHMRFINHDKPNRAHQHVDYQTQEDYAHSLRNAGTPEATDSDMPNFPPPPTSAQFSEEDARRMLSESGMNDDDDTTTTSGSYVISPEDLCDQIDDMFFKRDMVV